MSSLDRLRIADRGMFVLPGSPSLLSCDKGTNTEGKSLTVLITLS